MNNIIFSIRRLIYSLLYLFDRVTFQEYPKVVVFCYHSINQDNWRFSIDAETVKKQVEYLLKHFQPITAHDLELYLNDQKEITKPSFLITFDDGYQNITQLKDYMESLSIKPAVFVLTDYNCAEAAELGNQADFLLPLDMIALKNFGWEVGCHGASHKNFWKLTDSEIRQEVFEPKKELEKILGFPINYFAYPHGRYSPKIIKSMEEAGYKLAFSMDDSFISKSTPKYQVPRIGVDKTHGFGEFKKIFSPSAIRVRGLIKKVILSHE